MIFWIRLSSFGLLLTKNSITITANVTFKYDSFLCNFTNKIKNEWMQIIIKAYVLYENYNFELSTEKGIQVQIPANLNFDDSFSNITIGANSGGFKGFLWRFTVISGEISIPMKAVCNLTLWDDCLWDCSLKTWFSNGSCIDCLYSCDKGCVRSTDCNICINPLCEQCEFFNSSCEICKPNKNLTFVDSSCVCKQGLYLNDTEENCAPCIEGCLSCSNSSSCNECQSGFNLSEGFCDKNCSENEVLINHICECSPGYFFNDSICEPRYFGLNIEVNINNRIFLYFDTELNTSITKNDLKFFISIDFYYRITEITKKKYVLNPSFYQEVKNGTKFKLILESLIISQDSRMLIPSTLYGELFEFQYIEPAFEEIIKKTKLGVIVATSISVGATLASNPSVVWTLLNSLDYLSYMPLSKTSLTQTMIEYCNSIGSYSIVPNLMDKLINKNLSNPNEKAAKAGITSSVFFYNIGQNILIFSFSLICLPILLIFSRITTGKIRLKLTKIISEYRYNFFTRFWIQTYLSFGIFALISYESVINIKDILVGGLIYYISKVSSVVYIFAFLITPIILLVGILLNQDRIKNYRDPEFIKKFESLIFELKQNEGIKTIIYYPLFTLRRLFYAISQIYLYDFPVIQNTLNLGFILINFLYLIFARPFVEKKTLILNIMTEGFFVIIFFEVLLMSSLLNKFGERFCNHLFIGTIMALIGFEYLFSVIVVVEKLRNLIDKNRKKLKVRPEWVDLESN